MDALRILLDFAKQEIKEKLRVCGPNKTFSGINGVETVWDLVLALDECDDVSFYMEDIKAEYKPGCDICDAPAPYKVEDSKYSEFERLCEECKEALSEERED